MHDLCPFNRLLTTGQSEVSDEHVETYRSRKIGRCLLLTDLLDGRRVHFTFTAWERALLHLGPVVERLLAYLGRRIGFSPVGRGKVLFVECGFVGIVDARCTANGELGGARCHAGAHAWRRRDRKVV